MSDASERIASVVADALHESPSGERIEAVTEQVVADVLAIVREALLSEEAIDAAIDSAGNEFVGVYADAEDMIDAALNTAFGADDDGGES